MSGTPIWDGPRGSIIYRCGLYGPDNLFRIASDRSSPSRRISVSTRHQVPASVGPAGEVLVYDLGNDLARTGGWPLGILRPDGGQESAGLPDEAYGGADLSPDGRWLAYGTTQSGRPQVFVQPYGRSGPRYTVSDVEGGFSPCWRRDGRELYYLVSSASDATLTSLMCVRVSVAGGILSIGKPETLFGGRRYTASRPARSYDVTPDGHFVFVQPLPVEHVRRTEVNLVQNWFEELKAKVPPAR